MKIGLVSDLHVEFWNNAHYDRIGKRVQEQLAGADLILLAGDIDNGVFSVRTAQRLFPTQPVCLIAGNHEFYRHSYQRILEEIRQEAAGTNVQFLQCNDYCTTLNGQSVRVLGATLWTDFALYGTPDLSMLDAQRGLNDFRLIRNETTGGLLTPADTLAWHQIEKAWLLAELENPFEGMTIVMTHHAPVSFAVNRRFNNDQMSPCFASKWGEALARDDVALVVWGHTHHSVDQVIEQTRFVSSQTGYPNDLHGTETRDFGTIISL